MEWRAVASLAAVERCTAGVAAREDGLQAGETTAVEDSARLGAREQDVARREE